MKVETRTHVSFTLDELRVMDDKAYEKALEEIGRRCEPDADMVGEQLDMTLTDLLGDDAQITEWSVGWVQSDDVKFTASFSLPLTMPDWKPAPPPFPNDKVHDALDVSITDDGRSGPLIRITFQRDDDEPDESFDEWVKARWAVESEAEEEVRDWYRSMCHYLHVQARAEYEYWWDEEPRVEYARDMDLMFDEHGRLV